MALPGRGEPVTSACPPPAGPLPLDPEREEELPEGRGLPQLAARLQHGAVHVRRPEGGQDPGTVEPGVHPRRSVTRGKVYSTFSQVFFFILLR